MSINDAIGHAIGYLRLAILLLLLIALATTLLSLAVGFRIDVLKPLTPETLAYLAGAFWLTGKGRT